MTLAATSTNIIPQTNPGLQGAPPGQTGTSTQTTTLAPTQQFDAGFYGWMFLGVLGIVLVVGIVMSLSRDRSTTVSRL